QRTGIFDNDTACTLLVEVVGNHLHGFLGGPYRYFMPYGHHRSSRHSLPSHFTAKNNPTPPRCGIVAGLFNLRYSSLPAQERTIRSANTRASGGTYAVRR